MEQISLLLQNYKPQENDAPHDLSAIVNKIIEVAGESKKYGYGYWLRKVKTSKLGYNQILDLVDKARDIDDKYNKGGFLSNRI